MPEYYLGYRFVEGQPTVTEHPIVGYERQPVAHGFDLPHMADQATSQPSSANWKKDWLGAYSEQNRQAPVQLSFRLSSEGIAHAYCVENDGQQQRELFFQPFSQGVRMWVKLTTFEAIEGSYCLQQCLRFTGMFNAE